MVLYRVRKTLQNDASHFVEEYAQPLDPLKALSSAVQPQAWYLGLECVVSKLILEVCDVVHLTNANLDVAMKMGDE